MTKAPTQKPATDWEAIEREFRAGQLSLRQIGAAHGVTEGAIRKRAKIEGWERDLTDRVRQSVRQGLLRHDAQGTQAGTQIGTQAELPSRPLRRHLEAEDRALIDSAAARGVDVILRHRADAARLRRIHDRVMSDLEVVLSLRAPEDGRPAPVPVKAPVETLDRAAKIAMQIIAIERQAFNLDEPSDGGDDKDPIATLRAQLQGTAFKPTALTGGADGNG